MKNNIIISTVFTLLFLAIFSPLSGKLPVESFVETYYISGTGDTAGIGENLPLEDSSVTYRLYIDLEEGSRLLRIFGSDINVKTNLTEYYPFKISGTKPFFNHIERGATFGHQVRSNKLDENTLALDTWLSLGLATNKHIAVPKLKDTNGSILSQNLDGMLKNNHPDAGSITTADGLMTDSNTYSFVNAFFIDTTIFDYPGSDTTFSSDDHNNVFSLSVRGGISGPDKDNHILVAQLTTRGKLTFVINVEVMDSSGNVKTYVGSGNAYPESNIFKSPYLSYPYVLKRGCTDPHFVQYDPEAAIDDGSCRDTVVFGCHDPLACNFDTINTNTHLQELCCYNARCPLNVKLACPGTVYGCMDPAAYNYNPTANTPDTCCYSKGCKSSRYLEFDPSACFHDSVYCKILNVPGCTDPLACNYNPVATLDNNTCQYTGCGEVNQNLNLDNLLKFDLFPNPATDRVVLKIHTNEEMNMTYQIMDAYGKIIKNGQTNSFKNGEGMEISLEGIEKGLYLFKLLSDNRYGVKRIVKNE